MTGGRAAELLLGLAGSRAPTLGIGRLVCIDGPAGSGKTTLAAEVAARAPGAHVIHMDDLYDGWSGLPRVAGQLGTILGPLSRGETGSYRHYDWDAGRYTRTVTVAPGPLLVVEGVGAAPRAHAPLATVTAWVSAPLDLRLSRGLERDGPGLAQHWARWAADEEALFAREGVAARADVLVDGTGLTGPALRRRQDRRP